MSSHTLILLALDAELDRVAPFMQAVGEDPEEVPRILSCGLTQSSAA